MVHCERGWPCNLTRAALTRNQDPPVGVKVKQEPIRLYVSGLWLLIYRLGNNIYSVHV